MSKTQKAVLNKEICKRCISSAEGGFSRWDDDFLGPIDSMLWKEGYVLCCDSFILFCNDKKYRLTRKQCDKMTKKHGIDGENFWLDFGRHNFIRIDNIPKWCPYKLEHLMMDKKDAE